MKKCTTIMLCFGLLGSTGAVAEEHCSDEFAPPPDHVSVAWVAPVGDDVWFNGQIDVVRTTDLAEFLGREESPNVGRMLQLLGLKKSNKDPWRRYMVTIFDVPAYTLCRPVVSDEQGTIGGLITCEKPGRTSKRKMPCGYAVDRATGSRTVDRYRIRWNDAAKNGFCVLPATRYLEEGI